MTTAGPPESGGPRPVILFDGVCNLCNAAVQWVIQRDSQSRFDFASLQSDAGRLLLKEADANIVIQAPPDSVVLVDEGGAVHMRSSAAIAIAGRLGFPWSLFGITKVVPRPLRDAVYGVIARNRYRWFGRQDSCMMPTPELESRFLDAAEPRPTLPRTDPDSGAKAASGDSSSWAVAWLARLAIAYVLLYIAPTSEVLSSFTSWVGRAFFGVEATLGFTGSGDQTFNYLEFVVTAALAVVISLAWTVTARARAVSARTFDFSRFVARYYLGTTMLTYGWVKVFPLQFGLPGPDRLIQPYGDSSPMGLAWTFLGASVGYQIFAGLSELVGGYLLFWRRTTLLGSLIAAAVLSNVMAINYFFDVPVKLFSTHLLLFALFIAAPDLPRLAGLFGFNLPVEPRRATPFWRRSGVALPGPRWRVLAVMAVHLVFVGGITAMHVRNNLQASREYGLLAAPSPVSGIYRVESFQQDGLTGREIEDAARWVRVGINAPYTGTIQRASGDAVRMRVALDEEARTVSFFDRGADPPEEPVFTYSEPEPGVLRLEGAFEGKATVVLLRRDEAGALLTERGFRWINEFPFNR